MRSASGRFSAPRTISATPIFEPELAAAPSGEVLLAWSSPRGLEPSLPDWTDVHWATHPAGSTQVGYEVATGLTDGTPSFAPTGRLGLVSSGEALLAVGGSGGVRVMTRPPGEEFGPPELVAADGDLPSSSRAAATRPWSSRPRTARARRACASACAADRAMAGLARPGCQPASEGQPGVAGNRSPATGTATDVSFPGDDEDPAMTSPSHLTRRGAALIVVAAAFGAAPPAVAASPTIVSGRCEPARQVIHVAGRATLTGLRTVLMTQRVWIARTPGTFGAQFFACWRPTHEARRIGVNSGGAALTDAFIDPVQLHGRFVAFRILATGDERYARWRSFDVREQRFARDSGRVFVAATDAERANDFAVTTSGALGWIVGGVLHAADADGTHVLAVAKDGPITALQAAGRSLRWRQAGVAGSAMLR